MSPIITPGGGGGGGSQPLQIASFSLTAAQVKATSATPREVIAAPGAGNILLPLAAILRYSFVATPYSTGTVNFGIGSTAQGIGGPNNVLNQAADTDAGIGVFYSPSDVFPRVTFANAPLVLYIAAPISGPIVTAGVSFGGTNYAPLDTGTIDDNGAGGTGGTYRINTVDGGGAVLTFTVTAAGSRYLVTGAASTPGGAQPGVGAGFQLDITAVTPTEPGDGTLSGAIYYLINTG